MTMMSTMTNGREGLMDALRAEFGAILADRIIEAEATDFLWDARVAERYLGQHFGAFSDLEQTVEDISRVAFISLLDSRWHVGIGLVDGEGAALDLLWKQRFASYAEAKWAFVQTR